METISSDNDELKLDGQATKLQKGPCCTCLGVDDADIATGNYERWTQIPARLAGVVCIAIEAAGGQIVDRNSEEE